MFYLLICHVYKSCLNLHLITTTKSKNHIFLLSLSKPLISKLFFFNSLSLSPRDEKAEFANSIVLDEVPHLDLHCLP